MARKRSLRLRGSGPSRTSSGSGPEVENMIIRQVLHTVGTDTIQADALLNQSKHILQANYHFFTLDSYAQSAGETIFNEIDKVVGYVPRLIKTIEPWLQIYSGTSGSGLRRSRRSRLRKIRGGALIVSEDESPLREAVYKTLDAIGPKIARAITLFKESKTTLEHHYHLLAGNAYLLKDSEKVFRDLGNIIDHLTEVLKMIAFVIHQVEEFVP